MHSRIRRLSGGALALAVLAVGAGAWMNRGQDISGGFGPGAGSHAGSPGLRTAYHRFTVPFAQSLDGYAGNHTETILKVVNDSDRTIDVHVEWSFGLGGLAGTSGPETIPPHESRVLSTVNPGEDESPYWQSGGFRDTTDEFSGFARVFVGPNSGFAKNVTVQAVLVTDLGLGQSGEFGANARTTTELHVNRADDPEGKGIVDTRFKGD